MSVDRAGPRTGQPRSPARTGPAAAPTETDAPATGSGAGRWRGARAAWRRLPRLLRLVVVLHGLMLLSATVLYPNYRGPDEPLHVDLVAAVVQGEALPWPAPGERHTSLGVDAGSSFGNGRIAVSAVATADEAPPRAGRPSYADRGGDRPGRLPNQLVQHPPAYYLLMAPVLAVVPHWADQPFDRVVSWLRAVDALLLLPLPLLGYALARRVGLAEPVAVAAAAVPLAVPQLYHTGSAVNNDNLLLPLLAATSLLAAGVGRGDLRRRTAVRLGLLVGACLLTKGLGLFLPLLVALAYAVGASRAGLRRAVAPALLAEAVGIGTGGWWWVHNKLAYGVLQPDGTKLVQPHLVAHTSFAETGTSWLRMFAELMNRRFWLDPGATRLPGVATAATGLGALVVAAGVLLSLALGRPARRDALLLAVPSCALAGIVGWGSWTSGRRWSARPACRAATCTAGCPGWPCSSSPGSAAGSTGGRRWSCWPRPGWRSCSGCGSRCGSTGCRRPASCPGGSRRPGTTCWPGRPGRRCSCWRCSPRCSPPAS